MRVAHLAVSLGGGREEAWAWELGWGSGAGTSLGSSLGCRGMGVGRGALSWACSLGPVSWGRPGGTKQWGKQELETLSLEGFLQPLKGTGARFKALTGLNGEPFGTTSPIPVLKQTRQTRELRPREGKGLIQDPQVSSRTLASQSGLGRGFWCPPQQSAPGKP